jgi:hypothetical protein
VRVRIDDPARLPDLVEFLTKRADVVVSEVTASELEVSIIGSYGGDAMRMELELLLGVWRAARMSAQATILD